MPEVPAEASRAGRPALSSVVACVVLAMSMTTVILASTVSGRGSDYQVRTLLLGSDIALAALTLGMGRRLPAAARAWRNHACVLAGLVLGLAMVPAFLVHPSDRGAAALLRWGGAMALGVTLASAQGEGRRLLVGSLAAVTLAHVAVALAQRATAGPVGLGAIGEPSAYVIGDRYASTGLLVHPYVLAAWCAVCGTALLTLGRREKLRGGFILICGVGAFAAIGLTMSRAGAIAGVLALGVLAFAAGGEGRGWRPVAAAATALVAGVVVNLSGWVSRAGQATGSVDAISSGRGALVHQAWGLLRHDLLLGVGPGRYVLALSNRPALVALSNQAPRPVHVIPLLLVVEGGVLVVPALLLVGLAILRSCRRGGAAAAAVTLAMLPFLALDHLAWSYPQGIVLTGIWLGVLDILARKDEPAAILSERPTVPA